MSNHRMALVPVECWAYSSPEQLARGLTVDIGLLCESLIYYDQVLVNVSNEPQFAAIVGWFRARGRFDDFVAMLEDQTIGVFHYAFFSGSVLMPNGTYTLANFQDEQQATQPTFRRALEHASLRDEFRILSKGKSWSASSKVLL